MSPRDILSGVSPDLARRTSRWAAGSALFLLRASPAWGQAPRSPPPIVANTPSLPIVREPLVPAAAAAPAKDPSKPEPELNWIFLEIHGRVGATGIPGSKGDPLFNGTIGFAEDWIRQSGLQNHRASMSLALGGGGDGLQGEVAGVFAFGLRAPPGERHGPIARGAFAFRYEGHDRLLSSFIQLPQGQLGYQLMGNEVFLELGGTAAPVLTGRLNMGAQGTRTLDASLGWGGFVTAGLRYFPGAARELAPYSGLRLDVEFLRVEARSSPRTPASQLRGRLCGLSLGVVCADLSWLHGDQLLPGGAFRETTALYGGISLGLGALFADTTGK